LAVQVRIHENEVLLKLGVQRKGKENTPEKRNTTSILGGGGKGVGEYGDKKGKLHCKNNGWGGFFGN